MGIFLLALFVAAPCSAAVFGVSPDTITGEDPVIVQIQDLEDGAAFSLTLEGTMAASPGSEFSFSVDAFSMPFALDDGLIGAYTERTAITGFTASKDGKTISIAGPADEHGIFEFSKSQNITAGTYECVSFEGFAGETAHSITTRFCVEGTKQGPDDAVISFTPAGIQSGTLAIRVAVDGATCLDTVLAIDPEDGGDDDDDSPGSSGSSGSSGHSSGSSGAPSVITPPEEDAPSSLISSADGNATVTAGAGEALQVEPVGAEAVPEGWECLMGPYAVRPATCTFPEARIFSLALSEGLRAMAASSTLFVAAYDNGTWTILPSVMADGAMQATIGEPGTFALMRFVENAFATAPPDESDAGLAPTTVPAEPTPPSSGVPGLVSLIVAAGALCAVAWRRRN